MTLQEYMALKKTSSMKKEMRSHEATKFDMKTNFQEAEVQHAKTEQLTSSIKDQEMSNPGVASGENKDLLGFRKEEEFERRQFKGPRPYKES